MKISYAITVCNELEEITKLLNFLLEYRREGDEIVILFDKGNGTAEVWNRICELKDEPNVEYIAETFKHHFADWKNRLTELCTGDYIFQIDADEIPIKYLIINLPTILQSNPDNEVFEMFKQKFNCSKVNLPDESGNYRSTLRTNNDAIERLGWKPSDSLYDYIRVL